ncbi:hypothetical protein BDE02_10G094000 [Populus trichocarpa]|nr:hypothetical protein BDE02_10G094000 [Populus trichocarpa]
MSGATSLISFSSFRYVRRCFTLLYSGDADSSIVRETWARLIDRALSRGGVAEACSVLKRVGSCMYPGEGALLPLDTHAFTLRRLHWRDWNQGLKL